MYLSLRSQELVAPVRNEQKQQKKNWRRITIDISLICECGWKVVVSFYHIHCFDVQYRKV